MKSLKRISPRIVKLTLFFIVVAALLIAWHWSKWSRSAPTLVLDRLCAETVLKATLQRVPPGKLYPDEPSDQSEARVAQDFALSSQWQDGGRQDKLTGTITTLTRRTMPNEGLSLRLQLGEWGSVNYDFNKADLAHVRFIRVEDGREIQSDAHEFKPGDVVSVDVKTDYTRQVGSNQEFKITKL